MDLSQIPSPYLSNRLDEFLDELLPIINNRVVLSLVHFVLRDKDIGPR